MLDAELCVVLAAGGAVIALLVVIGFCKHTSMMESNKKQQSSVTSLGWSSLMERIAEAKNGQRRRGQHNHGRRRPFREDDIADRDSRDNNRWWFHSPSSSITFGEGRSQPPGENSPLLGALDALGGFEEHGQPGDWDYTGPDLEDETGEFPSSGGSTGPAAVTGTGEDIRISPALALLETGVTDEALLSTFVNVLSEGLALKIHRGTRKPRKVTLWLKNRDTLIWCFRRSMGTKRWHRLGLRGATHVTAGSKAAAALARDSGAKVDASRCLSVMFTMLSLDIEASSELECEALVQGFSMLIADLRREHDEA